MRNCFFKYANEATNHVIINFFSSFLLGKGYYLHFKGVSAHIMVKRARIDELGCIYTSQPVKFVIVTLG